MPNRILYERICTSETLAGLSSEQERLFIRLLVQADDHGRFYAHPSILRARCFPLQLDLISDADVEGWRCGLADAGLIRVYTDGGREYLHIPTWPKYQRMRAKDSKFPQPPATAVNGAHPRADASECPASADIGGSRARPPDPDAYSNPDANANANPPTPRVAGGTPLARRNTGARSKSNGAVPNGSLTPEEIEDAYRPRR